jgi:hypothetical protein
LAFVLAGALPVLITFVLCCAERVPAYQRARVARYASQLSQLTGLTVQVERVELLTPSRRLLHGIQLHHPETGAMLGQMKGLWISETSTGCALHAQQAELSAEHLADCYRLLHEQVLCRPHRQPHALVLWMNDLVIQGDAEPSLKFDKLQIELKRQPLATAGSLRFRLEDFPSQEAVMTFDRHHDEAEPTSHWTMNTGSQALPGAWVQRFANNFSMPGPQAAFTGAFDLAYNQKFWSLTGSGRMHRLDAAAWFERPLLSGNADVEINSFHLTDRGLREATGKLLVQEGRIHSDLLAASQHVGITTADGRSTFEARYNGNVLPFLEIRLGFRLDGQGLRIAPLMEDRVLAKDAVAPIAKFGEQYGLIPMVNLAYSLSNTAPTQSRTSTASWLVQWLPEAVNVPANHQVSQ